MPEKLYSYDEAADYLGVNKDTLRRYIRQGRLPVVKLSYKNRRITESALAKFIADNVEVRGRS